MNKAKILWVDDEIEFLQPHILFLRDKGYDVETANNAEDGIEMIRRQNFDLVLLDEMMPGIDGLTALLEIKKEHPGLPVIMITKNEEESLMEDAIGAQISDYLTKPVNPSQILLAAKKILESRNISQKKFTRDYMQELNKINLRLMDRLTPDDWVDIFLKLCSWDVELDAMPDKNLREIIANQRRECNVEFGKYVERNYLDWVNAEPDDRPVLSHDIVSKYVYPELKEGKKVAFFVIDCMRLDQWLALEKYFYEFYTIQKEYYFSILPTATPYARNAIFSGLLPSELEKRYPEMWAQGEDDDSSRNRYENELLYDHLRLLGLKMRSEPRYAKIISADEGYQLEKNLASFLNTPLLSIVVNFVDILAHSRSDLPILKQIAPDEPSYRSLTCSWFEHSPIYSVFKQLAEQDITIIVTSDHGSIRCMRGTKVLGDRETSSNLRYKYGRNLKAEPKHAFFINDPMKAKLPKRSLNMHYIIAKEDYYFVYPTNYHRYLTQYRDSFQHGGISLEEMVLPVIKLQPKK